MTLLQQLLEKRGELTRNLLAARDKMPGEERDATAEETQQWDAVNADYDANEAAITACEGRAAEIAKRDERLTQIEAAAKRSGLTTPRRAMLDTLDPDLQLRNAMRAWAGMPHGMARREDIDAARELGVNLYGNTFQVRLFDHADDTEQRVQHGLSGEAGGYLVQSPILANELEVALKNYSGMRQVSEIRRTDTGADYVWPGIDDTANEGELLPAPDTAATDLDLSYVARVWKAYEMSSKKIRVHRSLYQDSQFNILSHVDERIGERLGRLQNRLYTVGTGNSQPYGIVPGATVAVTAASASLITYDEMIDLEYAIDIDYRSQGCKYMANDLVFKVLRKLKDGMGNYLWKNADGSQPATFNGYPCQTNNNMATMAASAKTVLFGLLNKYKIREVQTMSVQRFIETRGAYNQDEFLGIMRADGKLLTVGQTVVACLQQHS